MQSTLYESLDDSARKFPQNNAIDFYGRRLSYSQLKSYADRFASLLTSLGVKKGDRVAMCVRNCPQFLFALYGSSRIGAILVPINPEYEEREISNVLSDCQPRILVCEREHDPERELTVLHTDPDSLINGGRDELLERLEAVESQKKGAEVTPDDVALVMYTSGTAKDPKGVMLTHRNVLANAQSGSAWCRKSHEDRSLAVLPFSHVLGLVESLCGSILCGSEVVILKKFSTKEACDAIEREKCTICTGVPPIFVAISRDENHDLSSLRVCFVGGASMKTQDIEAFERRVGCELLEGYGLTESAAQLTITPPRRAKHGSVGVPVPGVTFRVVDDQGSDLGSGETGELFFRGPQIMKGYWMNDKDSERALRDGWLHTEDLGYCDEEGYIYLVGRKDEIINVSGYKVLPEEVEGVLRENKKVREACATKSRDEEGREIVKAFVVSEGASERELIDWCRERIAGYKCPARIEFVDRIPKSASGKLLRREMR
jgi:long-chain acyl-CoA synthetase